MKRTILISALLFLAFAINGFSQTWTAQTSGVTTSLNCVSAVDANIGWIGGNGGVILKTVNGGVNWTNVANGTVGTADIYAISALSASVCLVSTSPANTFVYRTSDGGTTWTQVFTQVGGFIDDIRFKDANNGIMYGDPVSARWSIWRTTNAGVTWDSAGCYLPQAASEAGWNNAMFVNGNTVYFGTNSTKVYKSTNFGATGSWTSGATTGTANSYSVAFNGNTGFSGQTVAVKSTDGGSTYASATLPGSGTCYSFNTIPGTNRFWYNRAAIIYYSSDNGANFASQFTGSGTYQAMSLVLSGSVIRGWSVTNTGLIAMYNEPYAQIPTGTWTEQVSGITTVLYSVSAVNDDIAWTCGASGKVLRTTNKGQNWTNASGDLPTSIPMYNIFAWDANLAIVTGSTTSAYIYKTTNGGVNWATVLTTAGGFDDNLWMTSATDAYCIGDIVSGNWHLVKSTDAGSTWSNWATLPTSNTSGTYNNAACFLGQQVWFSGVGESKMFYSSNMGANWSEQTLTLANITATWFNSPTLGLAGGSSASAGMLKTTNSGVTWTAVTAPYPSSSISGIVGVANTWWAAQQGTGISISTNDGTTWTTAYTAPTGSFYHLTKSRSGATLWGIRSNGGISRYGAPIIGINPVSGTTPADYVLSQNYPNPFNPITKINFALSKSGLVSLKIYDILGQEVATLVNETKNAGNYSVDFDASKLSSGIYFYKISVNDFTDVKKMTLIK